MKNKKGFTLIELLAVIVVLGVILVIASQNILKSINNSKEKTKYMAAQEIVLMAEAYMEENDTTSVSVRELIDSGYLEGDLTNPETGKNITASDNLNNHIIEKSDSAHAQNNYVAKEIGSKNEYDFEGYTYTYERSSKDVAQNSTTKKGETTTTTTSVSGNTSTTTTKNYVPTTTKKSSSNSGNTCLVKGTKVKTKNGYKNIEDIDYDDLLAVWSYDLGKVVYEYPIWIEKESVSNNYQETIFSDGSVLKTVGFHGVFNTDLNKFVSVDDKENFKVGSKIIKVESGKLKQVTVKEIKSINKAVKYYHVETTRYYNIIANEFLTTDGYVELSNLYDFNDNITWKDSKTVLSDINNQYSYEDFRNFVPYYLYKGLRMNEAKYLVNNNVIAKDGLIAILNETMLNKAVTKKPISKNKTRYWMVTLSTDKVTETNKKEYLVKEGNTYKLPNVNGVKSWYNTSDNKYYKPGDKVKVYNGTYFDAIR